MRELERSSTTATGPFTLAETRLAVVGRGRLACAVIDGLREAPIRVSAGSATGLMCAATTSCSCAFLTLRSARPRTRSRPGRWWVIALEQPGLTRWLTTGPSPLHPLMTIPAGSGGDRLRGAAAAVAGTTPEARECARTLATWLGMHPFALADADRAAYHAAASVASNFLLTLEDAAERIAAGTGLSHEQLVPLVRATVENWAQQGAHAALTGPWRAAMRSPLPPNAQPSRSARRSCSACSMCSPPRPCPWRPARRSRHENGDRGGRSAQRARRARRAGQRIGLVPTMGAFQPAISR